MVEITAAQARRWLLNGHGLAEPPADGAGATVAASRRVCGLQAQDLFAAMLGVRVRSRGATLADVERARLAQRSVVWTWAMRGTLHLLAADDADWLLPLLGPVVVAGTARRREQLGITEDKYAHVVDAIRARLSDGPATREELTPLITAAGLEPGYSVERHVLYRMAAEGLVCMGPDRDAAEGRTLGPGAKPTYILLQDWLGRSLTPLPEKEALARLAERYLAAYAPATPVDMAAWSSLPVNMVRRGWDAIRDRLEEVTVDGRKAWMPRARLAEVAAAEALLPRSTRLLPAFDTYLLGHRSRDLVLAEEYANRINAGGGMIRAVILVDGYVAGTWQANRKGRRVNVTLDPFAPLSAETQVGIDVEIADISRFLNEE
jgi:hypothetical protein